jgi:hypothetical protein
VVCPLQQSQLFAQLFHHWGQGEPHHDALEFFHLDEAEKMSSFRQVQNESFAII